MKKYFFLVIISFTIFNVYLSNANLKDVYPHADYIIIYHPEFKNELTEFIKWRESKGFRVYSIDINKIYDEFQDTLTRNDAIRNFISFALKYWAKPAPKYVLLVGSVNHIPLKNIQSRFYDMPSYYEDTVSIDNWYALNKYDSDELLDISIGRFAVRNCEELQNIIAKTMKFEDDQEKTEYKYSFLFLTDAKDGTAFESGTDHIADDIIPGYLLRKKIYLRQDSPNYGTKFDFFQALNDGTTFLCYFGHGNPKVWTYNSTITSEDFDTANFTNKPFINTSASCKHSYNDTAKKGTMEILLSKKNGGIVTSFASTDLTWLSKCEGINFKFYKKLFENPDRTIGLLTLETLNELTTAQQDSYYFHLYSLLGDPALKLPKKIIASIQENRPNLSLNNSYCYPNPFSNSTTINYILTEPAHIKINIYNSIGNKIETLSDEYQTGGEYQITYNGEQYSAGMYYYTIQIGEKFETGKMLLIR